MGRPLRKDILGTDVIGTFTSDAGVRVDYHNGSSLVTTGIIKKQRGAKTFVCAPNATPTDTTSFRTVVLTDAAAGALTSGQMRLTGYVGGNADSGRALAKITKRVATDFSGNRYTWVLANDSTNDYIVLTAI